MKDKQFLEARLAEYETNRQTASDADDKSAFERWNDQVNFAIKRIERLESELGGSDEPMG